MKLLLLVLFGGMVVVTARGWRALDPSHRFHVSLGVPPSVEGTAGKRSVLLLYLGAGAVIFASAWVMTSEDDSALPWAGVGLLAYFLLMEFYAIRRALRR